MQEQMIESRPLSGDNSGAILFCPVKLVRSQIPRRQSTGRQHQEILLCQSVMRDLDRSRLRHNAGQDRI